MSTASRRTLMISFAIVILLLNDVVVTASNLSFRDIPEQYWAQESIADMVDAGVIKGYSDQTFRPGLTVTRAELAVMLTRAATLEALPEASPSFRDIAEGLWYSGSIAAAGYYISGYNIDDEQYFKPQQAATRAEVTVAIVKLLRGHETPLVRDTANLSNYSDWQAIAEADRTYISEAIDQGIVKGFPDKTLRPDASVTRAEATAIIWNVYNQIAVGGQAAPTNATLAPFEGRWRNVDMDNLEFVFHFADEGSGMIRYTVSGETFGGAFQYTIVSGTTLELTLSEDADGSKIMLSGDPSSGSITMNYDGELYRLAR